MTSSEGQTWTRDAAFSDMHHIMQAVSPPNIPNKVTSASDLAPWRCGPESSATANQLGRGANGAVYLYRHAKTQQPIAVKKFKLPSDQYYRSRRLNIIKREAGIQKELSMRHNFPQYYGWVPLDQDAVAIVMEFVGNDTTGQSTTLWKALGTSKSFPTIDTAFQVAMDIAEGMKSLHDAGFLINDLKCDNVLLQQINNSTHAKIIDFGHASRQNQPSSVYVLSQEEKKRYVNEGLYRHVAPEVALDGEGPTVRSDVFQMGQILKRMGHVLKIHAIYVLGSRCCHEDAMMRPSLDEVITTLRGGAGSRVVI